MGKVRARNLSETDVDEIVSAINAWRGKLTWDLLLCRIQEMIGQTYTRQAVYKHEKVRQSFSRKKEAIERATKQAHERSASGAEATKLTLLKAENVRLRAENMQLLAQFARWCWRRFKSEPPCRSKFEPGLDAVRRTVVCG